MSPPSIDESPLDSLISDSTSLPRSDDDPHLDNSSALKTSLPHPDGYFGEDKTYGGAFLPPPLEAIMKNVSDEYDKIKRDPKFLAELHMLRKTFIGRPSPIYHCKNLSKKIGGAQIYLKREDLNHTGSHKINHCLGEALLAKKMGKTKLIAETGAGQHGVALATTAALMEMVRFQTNILSYTFRFSQFFQQTVFHFNLSFYFEFFSSSFSLRIRNVRFIWEKSISKKSGPMYAGCKSWVQRLSRQLMVENH